jgi:bifunctional UDP-N-acetylglucosamine pyrophosphorylase/glucosamine-1-phosphate N-acetyltransferase
METGHGERFVDDGVPVTGYRPLAAVVLAAGEGTRMRSTTPKVLHPLCGRPMLLHVVDTLIALPLERVVVVVGHGAERVTKTLHEQVATELPIEFVEQRVQRGTGDAASVALTAFADDPDTDGDIIVMPGDAPLVRPEVLARLATEHRERDAAATVLTAELDETTADFGRVVRDDKGRLDRVVEKSDASEEELLIGEVNTSIYCFRRGLLAPALRRLSPENAQGEYYLTDVLEVLRQTGHTVVAVPAHDPTAALHVNNRAQLAAAEAVLRERINVRWMREGVGMVDPACTYIDASVELEPDVRLLPGTMLEGRTVIGAGSVVGPDCRLVDTIVGERAVIQNAVARDTEIGDDCTVGPYVSLRPGTRLAAGAHVGTFVETKNAEIGEGAKVPHLSYMGDVEIGDRANIGAGSITANYDGKDKHRTKIGADARIASNTVFVAPVEVGDDARTGAGAVVNRDVPPGAMAKGVPARIDEGWAERRAAEAPAGEPAGESEVQEADNPET